MIPVFDQLDLRSADAVIGILDQGAEATLGARCRRGSQEVVKLSGQECAAGARLVLSGDLHDNPLHLVRLLHAAGMDAEPRKGAAVRSHITLHELIHGDKLLNGMDFSYRVLCRVAALKTAWPEHVHILLANHELSQVVGAGIVKDGVRVVEAFNAAVEYTFEADAERVSAAINRFIRSLPLAVRFGVEGSGRGDIFCSHSLPGPEMMERFDAGVLERMLTDEDLTPRKGAAQMMVWGRGHRAEQLAAMAGAWGVELFVLGHEKAEQGYMVVPPNAVVLNSDHERGMYLKLDPRETTTLEDVMCGLRPLGVE